ncbi:MAG: tRNA uridine-5-carboxymethylaminomethyl(34) synthesis GTPase MnmE [Clostridia bacterium]|nr:tRNA uridine-5-carboxymethylaminomethyl(34) synthesis GTPase MnmE [Clostridia bacterium]
MTGGLLDTVAAVSTPKGKGGVALIRISGPEASGICGKIFFPAGRISPVDSPRHAVFGTVRYPEGSTRAGEKADTGICVYYDGPRSFTGEDTVEICCHGGVLVTRDVLGAALAAGARQAEPGEFTRRAFAAGKISLPEAESLGLMLDAGTDAQLKLSRAGFGGTLTAECGALREEITFLLADLYARIDFPEEDLGSLDEGELASGISGLLGRLCRLEASYRTGRAVASGIETVICGRTNVGKSSFFNLLTGSDDAIVTEIAGTTRDVITATVSFGGVTLLLSDTAGIRESDDAVEKIGIGRAVERALRAELRFFLIESAAVPDEEETRFAEKLLASPGITVALLTKSDAGDLSEGAAELASRFPYCVRVSAKTGEGIDRLAALISGLYNDGSLDLSSDPVIATARQYDAVARARSAIEECAAAQRDGATPDLLSVLLEDAASALSELDGRGHGAVSADVIERIFSVFCVGK